MHVILLFNAIFHAPQVGYDSIGHLAYITTLAQGELPKPQTNREYFSPPLPYAIPAALLALGIVDEAGSYKMGQYENVLFSVLLCWVLWLLLNWLRPGDWRLRFWTFFFLAMSPVYYKTFAFVRGEPVLALTSMVLAAYTFTIFRSGLNKPWRQAIILGLLVALAALSRQWAFLFFPGLFLFAFAALRHRQLPMRPALRILLPVSLVVAFVFGGWFYIHLRKTGGSITAFNRSGKKKLRLRNQPAEFYFGLGNGYVFSKPVRGHFNNQFFPRFFSEYWGDYEAYFLYRGVHADTGQSYFGLRLQALTTPPNTDPKITTNIASMTRYLGATNLLALLPTFLFLRAMFVYTRRSWRTFRRGSPDASQWLLLLLVCCFVTSVVGYFCFCLLFPSKKLGNTIKATYALQAVPLACIFAGLQMVEWSARRKRIIGWLSIPLVLIFLALVPVMITRFPVSRWPALNYPPAPPDQFFLRSDPQAEE